MKNIYYIYKIYVTKSRNIHYMQIYGGKCQICERMKNKFADLKSRLYGSKLFRT